MHLTRWTVPRGAGRAPRQFLVHNTNPILTGTRRRLPNSTRAVERTSIERPSSSDTWQRLSLLRRQLDIATKEEDYKTAARCRDESKALLEALPPVQQFLQHQAQLLRTGTAYEKMNAMRAMAEAGDPVVIPDLAVALADREMNQVAGEAMWALFMRSHDPSLDESMAEGCRLMADPSMHPRALSVFSDLVSRAPGYAEAWNKRATLLYMMRRYEDSIADCQEALARQQYHFGAASGMGLCYLMLGREEEAKAAFETALSINPGLDNITRVLGELKKRTAQAEERRQPPSGIEEASGKETSGKEEASRKEEGTSGKGEEGARDTASPDPTSPDSS